MSIRVGIVGAGRMGNAHLQRLEKIKDVKVIAICDVVRENAERLSQGKKKIYQDLEKMLNKEDLNAIWILTPANVHSRQVEICLKRGIPFFLEKPVTINLEEGKKVLSKIKEKKVLHSIGYMSRYLSTVEKLKKILKGEKLALVSAEVFWTIPLVDSIKSKEKAGGQIVDQATHLVDLMRYLVGEITEVFTRRIRGLFPEEKLYTGDDASATIFQFKNGVVGNLVCTYSLFPEISKTYPFKMLFICKRKLIEYVGNYIRIITSKKEEKIYSTEDAYLLEDETFIQAIRRNDPSLIKSNYEDAFKTIKVSLSANKSMETRNIVTL